MVLTRRAAKAAAEAEAAALQAKTQAKSPAPVSPPKPEKSAPPQPVKMDTPPTKPKPSLPSPEKEKEALKEVQMEAQRQNQTRAAVANRLHFAHLLALLAAVTVTHAATLPAAAAHPLHAVLLLLSIIPLRFVLALSVHGVRAPSKRSGTLFGRMFFVFAIPFRIIPLLTNRPTIRLAAYAAIHLALSAPVVFASNALHVLATRASPPRLLLLMTCGAVDICASWLHMAVTAHSPTVEPFVLVITLIHSAADVFLAAIVAHQQAFLNLFFPFLGLRFVLNLRLVIGCTLTVVRRDVIKNQAKDKDNALR